MATNTSPVGYDDLMRMFDGDGEDTSAPEQRAEADKRSTLSRDMEGPLPDGLQLLVLEMRLLENRFAVTDPICYRDPGDKARNDIEVWGNALRRCFVPIGQAYFVNPEDQDSPKKAKGTQLKVNIIASPAVLEKWTEEATWPDCEYEFKHIESESVVRPDLRMCAEGTRTSRWPSLGGIPTEHKNTSCLYFKGIDLGDFLDAASCDENTPGAFAEYARAVQATYEDFEKFKTLLEACNGDAVAMDRALQRMDAKTQPQSFLVPGLIPRGAITLLLGNRKVGKSAMALELAVTTARREKEWLGFPVDASRGGFAVYMFGEDSAGEVFDRVNRMTSGESPYLLHSIPASGNDLDSALADLAKQKISLLVVDPARKFFQGDEDGSDAVNDFFARLETFARAKDCALVVSHHLKRNASPRTLEDVALLYRGSSVFLDRPRVTLAALRHGDETHFGVPAPDGVPLHNFRQSDMFAGVRRLRRDEASFRHVPIAHKMAAKESTAPDASRVLEAARRVLASGSRLTRTGAAALFERKLSDLAGMSRAAVRTAVDDLVSQGELLGASDGTLALPEN